MTIYLVKLNKTYMKKIIINCVITFALELLALQIAQAQGTVYVSNLSQASTSSVAVGSNSWQAVLFEAGTNSGGYVLNSVQLEMTGASNNPSGFTVMVYSAVFTSGVFPGNSLGILTGSLNPITGGIYTYTPVSGLTLSPGTTYFVVLTAATAIANGAYTWSSTSTGIYSSYNPIGGWIGGSPAIYSSNGSSWTPISGAYPQFAVSATAIPEPGVLSLFALGGVGFRWHRRKAKAH
jgi:hypothetical protein